MIGPMISIYDYQKIRVTLLIRIT